MKHLFFGPTAHYLILIIFVIPSRSSIQKEASVGENSRDQDQHRANKHKVLTYFYQIHQVPVQVRDVLLCAWVAVQISG